MRVVALPPDENGKIAAVLQIAPDEGWHTYWRAPGSGGIPPQVTVENGGNLLFGGLDFPPPQIITYGNLRDYGYEHPISLPLELKQVVTGLPSHLKLSAFVGVCAEICVPFSAQFDLTISASEEPQIAERKIILQAKEALPETPGDDFAVVGDALTVSGRGLELTIRLPDDIDAGSSIVIANDGGQAFEPDQIKKTGNGLVRALFEPKYLPSDKTLSGRQLEILVIAGERSMQTALVLK